MPEVLDTLSDYVMERNKPIPNLTQGALQERIIILVEKIYKKNI